MTTFVQNIWQHNKCNIYIWNHVPYNSIRYTQPVTEVQRSTHILNRSFMVSMCGSHRLSNKHCNTNFSLSSEQTDSVILLAPCIVATICTHQHHIKIVCTILSLRLSLFTFHILLLVSCMWNCVCLFCVSVCCVCLRTAIYKRNM